MSLRLVFSWFADGGAWPEHPGLDTTSVDAAVVGPLGLLDHLETMLGLGAPAVGGAHRIAAWSAKLASAGADRFWSRSFATDQWSTARELLTWRDELVEAGWRPSLPISSRRIADLAAAEAAGPALPLGVADRLRAVIDAFADGPALPLRAVETIDARDDLPIGWRTLLDRLAAHGTAVTERRPAAPAGTARDLDRLLTPFATDGTRPALVGDDTVTRLVADTETMAAEALAAWLVADPRANDDLVFVLGKDTDLLDHALHRAGLPRLGGSAVSPHRALFQILPLAFRLAWSPPDPATLLDFLLLPVSPLPRWVANRLATQISETPGTGGPVWEETFADIARRHAELEPDATPSARAAIEAGWRAFVEPERHDPESGIPVAAARAVAGRVATWATARGAITGDDLFRTLASTAADLVAAIDATGAERLDRLLAERMIEQVIGEGVDDPTAVTEAAPWRRVVHPGAIWGPAGTVVWWHFADGSRTGTRRIWSTAERAALTDAGVSLDDPATALRLDAAAWERPLFFATDRVILVTPAATAEGPTEAHPFWHALAAGRPDITARIDVTAETLLDEAEPILAGRRIEREPVRRVAMSDRRAEWIAPAGAITARAHESASSLGALLACPFQWTLQYGARLRTSARRSLPGNDAVTGSLAHRIAEILFAPGPPPPAGTVRLRAATLVEELLPQMAATLLLPGSARDLAAARRSIPDALAELAQFLAMNELEVVGTEIDFTDDAVLSPTTGLAGAIDLLARDRDGRPVIVDLKWQRTDRYRRREIESGTAIQLAVYARHVRGDGLDVPTGYFMLRQRRFVTGSQRFGGPVVAVAGRSTAETWERIAAGWSAVMAELGVGHVRAPFDTAGVEQARFVDPILMTPPKCDHCDFAIACGRPS